MKPNTALTGQGGPIRLPPSEQSERVTAETELGVLLGREGRRIDESSIDGWVAGYLSVMSMTAEDVLQRIPRFLTRAKSFDTFLVVGPTVTVPEGSIDLAKRIVQTRANGTVEAENEIAKMLFPPEEILAFHSDVMPLRPGDLFSTGRPARRPSPATRCAHATVGSIGSMEASVRR